MFGNNIVEIIMKNKINDIEYKYYLFSDLNNIFKMKVLILK
jgi:hypothetical protein